MAEYEGKLVEIIVGKSKSRIAGEEKLEAKKKRDETGEYENSFACA